EEQAFKDVYEVIIGASYDTQITKPVDINGVNPVLTLTYHITVGNQQKTLSASYLPYDDSFYIVNFDGAKVRFLADKRKIDTIIKTIEEFKKPTLAQ
ncbi:MAG TPA: hypothetical protein VN131_03580, partial [Mobilitalea sp.]|nr:hypothetical protein [Mobilitalea sp.]